MSLQGDLEFRDANKITFIGGSSNTVIDLTTGSLGVGVDVNGPTSNLHVVGNTRLEGDIDMLHTANTASIKLNSNVVAEFPRSKKLIKYPRVALTADNDQSYIVTRSSQYSDYNAWEAFDENNPVGGNTGNLSGWASTIPGNYSVSTGAWGGGGTPHHTGSTEGEWIQIQLPDSIYLHDFVIESRSETTYGPDGYDHGYPKDVVLYGSINGSSWDTIKTFTTGQKTFSEAHTENINETRAYKYFTLVVNSTQVVNNTTLVTWTSIGQIRLYGVPEYDPEADGTDVTVKSLPNVPNTDWLEVYYDANEYTNGVVQDLSTNSFNATLTNGATFNNSDGINKFTFDAGLNQYMTTTTNISGEFVHTTSMWVKFVEVDSDSNNQHYLFMLGTFGSNSIGMYYSANQGIRVSPTGFDYRTQYHPVAGKWFHVSYTYAGGAHGTAAMNTAVKFYINGKQWNIPAYYGNTTTVTLPSSSVLQINGSAGNNNTLMDMEVANFRIFNRALTSDEIWQLYAYQKKYFGHGDLSMTLKAGRLGIGTSEPRAALDVRGDIHAIGSVNPVIGIWKQTIDSTTVTTTILTNIGSCMSTKTPDGWGAETGFSGSAGIFIAPYDGIYQFQAFLVGQSGSSNCLLVFNANGPSVVNGTWNAKNVINDYREVFDLRGSRTDAEEPFTFATLLNMSKGDYVDIQNHSTGFLGSNTVNCSAYLVHRLN